MGLGTARSGTAGPFGPDDLTLSILVRPCGSPRWHPGGAPPWCPVAGGGGDVDRAVALAAQLGLDSVLVCHARVIRTGSPGVNPSRGLPSDDLVET